MKTLFLPIQRFFPERHHTFLNLLVERFHVILSRHHNFHFRSTHNIEYLEDIVDPVPQDELLSNFQWEMCDFIGYMKNVLNDVIDDIPDVDTLRKRVNNLSSKLLSVYFMTWQFRILTERRKIDMVIVSAEYSCFSRAIVIEAKRKKIITVNIEHGYFGMLPYPDICKSTHPISTNFISDYVILDNNLEGDIMGKYLFRSGNISNTKLLPVGTPLDGKQNVLIGKKHARKSLHIDPDKFTVTLIGSWVELRSPGDTFQGQIDEAAFLEFTFHTLKDFVKTGKLQVIVKLHPTIALFGEDSIYQYIENIAKKYSTESIFVTTEYKEEVIEASDVMVSSSFSSLVWEAMIKDKPVAIQPPLSFINSCDVTQLNEQTELCKAGLLEFIFNETELRCFIEKYMKPEENIAFQARRKTFFEKWQLKELTPEEKSLKICQWIDSILKNNEEG